MTNHLTKKTSKPACKTTEEKKSNCKYVDERLQGCDQTEW